MTMKIFLLTLLPASVFVSAQLKERKLILPKKDTSTIQRPDRNPPETTFPGQKNDVYKMPVAQPDRKTSYSSLKENRKDTTDYKILNATPPKAKKERGNLPLK